LPSFLYKVAYHFFSFVVPKPDILFFIDVKPEVAYGRVMERTTQGFEMFEKPEELQKIRRRGLELALIGKWLIVDGGKPAEDVELAIRNSLEHR